MLSGKDAEGCASDHGCFSEPLKLVSKGPKRAAWLFPES